MRKPFVGVLLSVLLMNTACAPTAKEAFVGTWSNEPTLAQPPYKSGEYQLRDQLIVSADGRFRWEPTGLGGSWLAKGSELHCKLDAPFPPLSMLSGDESNFSLSLKDNRLVWEAVGARVDPKPVYTYVKE